MPNLVKKANWDGIKQPKVDFKSTLKGILEHCELYNTKINDLKAKGSKKQPLKLVHISLIKEVVRKMQRKMIDSVKLGLQPDRPLLYTNNHELSIDLLCSKSTVQRAIKRLIDARVITFKVFRGTKANYILYLNPDLIQVTCQQQLRVEYNRRVEERIKEQKEKLKLSYTDLKNYKRSKCPVSSTICTDTIKNLEMDGEDVNLQKCKSDFSIGERKRSRVKPNGSEGKRVHQRRAKLPQFKNKMDEFLWIKSIELLNYSIEKLYKPSGIEIFPAAYQNALEMIHKAWFTKISSPSQADQRMRQYRWRIDFQSRQLRKENSFILPPSEYFSLKRISGGFRGTKDFYQQWRKTTKKDDKQKAKINEFDRIVRAIVLDKSFVQYNKGLERVKVLFPNQQDKLDEFFARIQQAFNPKD